MQASDRNAPRPTLRRRLLAALCTAGMGLSALMPLAAAAEVASTGSDVWIAQQGRGSRGGSSGRVRSNRSGGGSARRESRRSGAGALGRPAPGFDRGNRRPSGGWVDRTRPGSLRPAPAPQRPRPGGGGSINRPRPDGNRPGPNRPDGNRPGGNRPDWNGPASNRPDGNRPGNRPDWNRPDNNRPDWNRPDGNRPGPNRPDGNRPDWNRPGSNRPDWNRPDWNRPGWNRPDWVFGRPVINNTFIRPGWWGPRWASSRPWRYGWYDSGYNRWGWWNQSSLLWGITSLASAAIISSAINDALSQNQATIVVKDSPYQLVFGSVNAVSNNEVVFNFLFGDATFEARANCRQGTINGRQPENPEEAQLINAACQVAFSSFN